MKYLKSKSKRNIEVFINPIKENRKNKRAQRNAYYINCIRQYNIKENSILLESYHGVNFTGIHTPYLKINRSLSKL